MKKILLKMVNYNNTSVIHFFYITSAGKKIICGVCLRNECTSVLENVNCKNCLRLLHETDILEQIKDDLD